MPQTEAVRASDQIQFCSEQPDPNSPNSFNGPRNCTQMIQALGAFLREQIIDETDPPADASVSWRFHHAHTGSEQVLNSVTRQTGLSFEKEIRQVRRLVVEERSDP